MRIKNTARKKDIDNMPYNLINFIDIHHEYRAELIDVENLGEVLTTEFVDDSGFDCAIKVEIVLYKLKTWKSFFFKYKRKEMHLLGIKLIHDLSMFHLGERTIKNILKAESIDNNMLDEFEIRDFKEQVSKYGFKYVNNYRTFGFYYKFEGDSKDLEEFRKYTKSLLVMRKLMKC